MKAKRKIFEESLDAQLHEWNAQIDLHKAKADKATLGLKLEYYIAIDSLQQQQKDVRSKLQELTSAGDEAWEDLRTGAEKTWAEVKSNYHAASSRFK